MEKYGLLKILGRGVRVNRWNFEITERSRYLYREFQPQKCMKYNTNSHFNTSFTQSALSCTIGLKKCRLLDFVCYHCTTLDNQQLHS